MILTCIEWLKILKFFNNRISVADNSLTKKHVIRKTFGVHNFCDMGIFMNDVGRLKIKVKS